MIMMIINIIYYLYNNRKYTYRSTSKVVRNYVPRTLVPPQPGSPTLETMY